MHAPGEATDLGRSCVQVVIPFHGPLDLLRESVDSVRNSIGVRTALLVIDNRSEIPNRPEFLKSDEYLFAGEIGLSGALQFSKNFLTESYVAILAADDLAHPRRFMTQLSALISANADVCLCRMSKFGEKHRSIPSLSGEIKGDIFLSEFLLLGPYGADGTMLMTRDFFVNRFFLDPEDSFADWTLALQEYPHTAIASVDEKLYLYRQHGNQVTRNYQNPWEQSGVISKWLHLCEELEFPPVNEETMQIICAPWYRFHPSKDDLSSAMHLLGEIYKNVQEKTTNREAIASVERVILRRMIFRTSLRNLAHILGGLGTLNIPQVRIKFIFESINVLRDIVTQSGVRPRRVFPTNP